MKISCSSQSFDRLFASGAMDLPGFIEYSKRDLDLDAVEFEDKHIAATDAASLAAIRARCAEKGLGIANVAFFNSFGFSTPGENEAELTRAVEWMNVAVKLGCPNFRIFAGWMGGPDREIGFAGSILPKPEEAWRTMTGFVKRACEEAEMRRLNVVVENHNHGGFLSTSHDVLRLFADVPAANMSLLLDTGNYADGIDGIAKTVRLATRHIHLKCREIRDDGSDAAFDLAAIIDMIRKVGFDGNLSFEYEGTQDEKSVLPKLIHFVKTRLGK